MQLGRSSLGVATILTFGATSKSGLVRVDVSALPTPLAYLSSKLVEGIKKYLQYMRHLGDNADWEVVNYWRIQFDAPEVAYVLTEDGDLEVCTLTISFLGDGSAVYQFTPVGFGDADVCVTLSGFRNIPFGLAGVKPIHDVARVRALISAYVMRTAGEAGDATLASSELDTLLASARPSSSDPEVEAMKSVLLACVEEFNEKARASSKERFTLWVHTTVPGFRLPVELVPPFRRTAREYVELFDDIFGRIPNEKGYLANNQDLRKQGDTVRLDPSWWMLVLEIYPLAVDGGGAGGAGGGAGGR